MHKALVLKIKRKSLAQWLIWCIIVLPFLFYLLFDLLKLPRFIMYSFDVCWMGLLMLNILTNKKAKPYDVRALSTCIIIFLIYTAVNYIFNYQSIFYYIWGLRNNFRFYVFFLAVICYMNYEHIMDYLKMMDTLFWINAVVSLVQFYIFHKRGDHTGGLFGTTKGVNAYTIIFLSIVLSKSILMYLRREERIELCLLKVAVALVIIAHAELKVSILILILVGGMALLLVNFSWRKLLIIAVGILAIIVGTTFIGRMFGDGSNSWFNLENLLELAWSEKGYTQTGDLNRLAAIFQINKRFDFTWNEKLFGLGLGNCDTSSVSLFNTPFSSRYFSMHHTWFSIAMIYLETGYCGIIQYLGLFILCYVLARKKKQERGNELYCMMAMIMAAVCCVLFPYNASLRVESGYMAYFIMALPFVYTNKGHVVKEIATAKEVES